MVRIPDSRRPVYAPSISPRQWQVRRPASAPRRHQPSLGVANDPARWRRESRFAAGESSHPPSLLAARPLRCPGVPPSHSSAPRRFHTAARSSAARAKREACPLRRATPSPARSTGAPRHRATQSACSRPVHKRRSSRPTSARPYPAPVPATTAARRSP